ncbi:MAG: SH3 domain-containing protein [Leptonema illini]|uniref:SH3 domain-containing protein n=1 Tax=Leptonema illini TaxID=183 RepID=A0A833GXN5_9LEPT|nr:MAG: SH3 domain-containing protein [Leptonema illini]
MRSWRGRAVFRRSLAGLLFAVSLLPLLFGCRDAERPSSYTWNDNRPQLYFRVVTPSGLNLRSEASVQSGIVTTLLFDTIGRVLDQTSSVEVIQGRRGFWMQTEVKGQKGWIFSGFVITSTNIGDLSPMTLETDPERLPLIEASSLQGSHSVEKLELPGFVVESYALEEDHVAAIPLHLHPSKKASCFYSHAPIGPIQPAVEVRRSANVLYTLVKVPICEPTPEQNALLQKGEELLVEDVRLFSSISLTRLEVTARGFNLLWRQVASVPDEFRAEWDQAELLEEP